MQIKSSVAVVSGGASGLGKATATRLVELGAKVVIADRDAKKGQATAAALGENAVFIETDVTSEEAVQAAVTRATELGPLRIAVSCAGIGWAQRTVSRSGTPHPAAPFQTVLNINVLGTFNVLRLAASAMSQSEANDEGERGVVINTASIAAYDGQIGQLAYSASKGAIVGMTLPAARDLTKAGVRVVTIAPGLFDTPLLSMLPEEARQALGASIPFPARLGKTSEYARLVQAIVENPYLNGETIRLDGALRMAPK